MMDIKITKTIEKLSDVIRTLFWNIGKEEGLTPIQIQFLIYLSNHSDKFCRISQLAKDFNLTQATVSDSVNTLGKKGLISKVCSEYDKRVRVLKLTGSSEKLISRLSEWPNSIREYIRTTPPEVNQTIMVFLMGLIAFMQKTGIVSTTRMCITCDNFRRDAHPATKFPHHCDLTDRVIDDSGLNIDCERHIQKDQKKTFIHQYH